jgi:hypothetical protein
MYKKQQNVFKKLCSVACCFLHLVVPELVANTHNAHSKLQYKMLFPNNVTGNCRTILLSIPLSWYLDRDTKCIQMVS